MINKDFLLGFGAGKSAGGGGGGGETNRFIINLTVDYDNSTYSADKTGAEIQEAIEDVTKEIYLTEIFIEGEEQYSETSKITPVHVGVIDGAGQNGGYLLAKNVPYAYDRDPQLQGVFQIVFDGYYIPISIAGDLTDTWLAFEPQYFTIADHVSISTQPIIE